METRFAQKIADAFLEKCVKDLVPKEEAEADDEEGDQEVTPKQVLGHLFIWLDHNLVLQGWPTFRTMFLC